MKRLAPFVVVALLVVVSSGMWITSRRRFATPAPRPEVNIPEFTALGLLNVTNVFGDSTTFAFPVDLKARRGKIVVVDQLGDSAAVIINIEAGTIRKGGRRGKGPGEFLQPVAVDLSEEGDWFAIHDLGQALYQRFALDSLTFTPFERIAFNNIIPHAIRVNDTLTAAAFISPGMRLALYSVKGAAIAPQHVLTTSLFPQTQGVQAAHLNRFYLTANPRRTRFALAFTYATRVMVVDDQAREIVHAAGPVYIRPMYRADKPGDFAKSDKTKWAYADVDATERHIYALFSGRSRKDAGDEAFFSSHVDVFTWAGRYVGTYELSRPVTAVTISDGTIYGIQLLPYPQVVAFAKVSE